MAVLARQSGFGSPPPPPPPDRYQSVPLLNQRSPLLGLTIYFLVCSWICSLLRLYTRCVIERAPGWDDLFIVLTMLSTTLGSSLLCIMTDMGLGKPIISLSLVELQRILRIIYVVTLTYPMSFAFIKIALLLQYLRTFTGRRIRIFCKITLAVTTLTGIAFGVCSWFPCFPVAAFWDFSIREAYCWGFGSRDKFEFIHISILQVVITAALDLVVFFIPTWLFFQPDTTKSTRFSLLGLLILGLCAILCSLWRLVYIIRFRDDDNTFDPIWDDPTVMGLASFEVHLAAVCAALPVLWPALKTTWNRIMVTYEVSVTQEYHEYTPRHNNIEMQLGALERKAHSATTDTETDPNQTWKPFVGDETTGLGESETVVESLAGAKRPPRYKQMLQGISRGFGQGSAPSQR